MEYDAVSVHVMMSSLCFVYMQAQQHMFNMPFQLSHPSIIESPDDADSADVTEVRLAAKDWKQALGVTS